MRSWSKCVIFSRRMKSSRSVGPRSPARSEFSSSAIGTPWLVVSVLSSGNARKGASATALTETGSAKFAAGALAEWAFDAFRLVGVFAMVILAQVTDNSADSSRALTETVVNRKYRTTGKTHWSAVKHISDVSFNSQNADK